MDTRKLITLSAFGGGLLCLGLAIAPRFDATVVYRLSSRTGSAPSWLVPAGAEFKSLESGYGSLKFPAALAGTGLLALSMGLARKHGAEEGTRQRIKHQRRKAEEAKSAIHHAYELQFEQAKCDAVFYARRLEFEAQVEEAFVQSMGISPTLPALPGTTLEQTTNPGDKVRETEANPAIADSSPTLPNMTNYPSVLVYGAQGSGKSTFALNEIKKRSSAGHQVVVLDPHAAYGAWSGCEVIGGGMDYAAIDAKLKWFSDEVSRRYKIIQSQPNPQFRPLTLVCDEFTNWALRCDNSGEFFKTALSDIRKAQMFALIVSHVRTMSGLGNAKGVAALRDEALLEIELLGQLDPVTGKAVPKFEALVKLPGQSLGDRTLIKIPRRSEPSQPTQQSGFSLDAARNWLESTWSVPGVEPPTRKPSEPQSELLNRPEDKDSGDSGQRFTPLHLTRQQAQALINQLRTELNQTQIIERLWACKKGGSADWKIAHAQFKELMGEP